MTAITNVESLQDTSYIAGIWVNNKVFADEITAYSMWDRHLYPWCKHFVGRGGPASVIPYRSTDKGMSYTTDDSAALSNIKSQWSTATITHGKVVGREEISRDLQLAAQDGVGFIEELRKGYALDYANVENENRYSVCMGSSCNRK